MSCYKWKGFSTLFELEMKTEIAIWFYFVWFGMLRIQKSEKLFGAHVNLQTLLAGGWKSEGSLNSSI